MAYEVLARKWRPKTFDDVVGQGHVTRTLANAIEQDRIAHAYLFIGPRGIGKTTLSRILAMALNCEKGPTTHPCGECDNCKGIAAGSDMDVIELDAASNNKVEDIHAVLDQVQFAPTHSRFKVFILDEVHMLSNAAFNALLKTLEEPPPYVKFIFATTEGDKVLPTIVSRCQRFDLRRISVGDIVQRLRFICNAEKIEITDDALLAIARGSNGGLRDALSALDQLIAFKGTDLSEADVLAVFGLVSREALEGLAESILKGDIPGILRTVAALDESGKDMRRMTAELLWHFRNLLVCQQAGAELAKQDVTAEQLAVLEAQAKLAPPQRIVEISSLLSEMEGKLRAALSVRTLVEMTLIRCARAAKTVSLDEEKPEPEVAPDLSEKKAEPQPEPETSPIDDLWADALSKGKTADSIAANDQKKGSPQGHAAAEATVGSPGYGDYDLGGRGLVGRLPKPEYSGTNDEGTIVVEVLVAPDGRVVQANVTPSGSKGTAASNATLRSRAEAAARRAVFERKASGNENQWGSITYYFKQN